MIQIDEVRRNRINQVLKTLNIELSPEQADVFWCPSRNVLNSAGEGAGKTTIAALRAVTFSMTDPHPPVLGWVVGCDFEDTYKELIGTSVADLSIRNLAETLGILDRAGSTISMHTDQRCRLHLVMKATSVLPALNLYIESISGYDPPKIGRDEPDFILGAECGRWEYELWQRAQGRLARKYPSSWGYFSGSPEVTQDWFSEIATLGQGPNILDLTSFYLPSYANRVIYPGGASDPAILQLQATMSNERFLARHMGKPTVSSDAVLPEFKHSLHIYPVQYETGFPVYTFIDPGTTVCAVLFVQMARSEVKVLNELYLPRVPHEQAIGLTMMQPEWKYVREGVIDVAGGQHHFGAASAEEAWVRDTGLRLKAEYRKVQQVIERLRSLMQINPVTQRPYLLIHPKCTGLISEMGGGRSPNPSGGLWRMGPGGVPLTKNDHACKALGYGVLTYLGTTKPYQQDLKPDEEEDVATYFVKPRSNSVDEMLRRIHA